MTTLGKTILEGLEEAVAHAKGEKTSARETLVQVPTDVDVLAIRKALNLSQEEFAIRFGFGLGTVRNWEQGRRRPEGPVRAYLKVIEKDHEAVEHALAG